MQVLIISAVVCLLTFGLVAGVGSKYDERRVIRPFGIAAVCVFIACIVLLMGSNTYEAECFGGGAGTCNYDDTLPLIGLLLFVFAAVGTVKAWLIYSER